LEKGVERCGAEGVVGDSCGDSEASEGGELEEGVEGTVWDEVEIEVDPAVVVEEEVAYCVGALDRIGIGIVNWDEGRIVGLDECVGGVVCPELHPFV
jgi:hypothetical protein